MEEDHKNIQLQELAESLKRARSKKGLSQRALSKKIGVPQGHISKIENGKVDIKLSSLIEIARALDLEFMLMPRQLVPVVEALSRADASGGSDNLPEHKLSSQNDTVTETHRSLERIGKEAGRLSRKLGDVPELMRLSQTVQELDNIRFNLAQAEQIKNALETVKLPTQAINKALAAQQSLPEILKNIDFNKSLIEATRANDALRNIRNALAHGASTPTRRSTPAYRLSEEVDDA
ncbi:helix-turn-helix domain-containing protein [Emcibacter nanhaiensis]|uniref:Helix-turn-helix domain-containing protein n=1 Tax=Emcibacter nanhaiensis TaxID=1505037 RepID=A0A501PH25_9PROT|nr:helix-turn-helix transcriptional regulator [Emcibacter nanhaiensis]TPD59301.1 helix-turn-helix domain-containing protein [Emcibacter nanhaiensis]